MDAVSRPARAKALGEFLGRQTAVIFFLAYLIGASLFVPRFANLENLINIVVQSSDLIILACGLTFVFLNGGIDFSVTAVIALDSVIGAKIMTGSLEPAVSIPLGILAMLGVALVIGAFNGFAVTRLKMPSFIATMASQLVFSGIALTMTQSKTIGGVPVAFNEIAQGRLLGVNTPVWITAAIVALLCYLLNSTVYGRQVVAVGTNHKTSIISGLPVKPIIFSLFIISSLCAAASCVIMTGRLGAGVPSLGKDMLMDVVAAVVIGGTSIAGGKGNIVGSMIGAVLVVMLNNSLNLLGIDWYYIMVCKGAVILVVTLFQVLRERAK